MPRAHARRARRVALAFTLSCSAATAATAELPPDCGSLGELEAELERRLPPGTSLESTHVSIAPHGSELLLRVRVGNELRELRDQDCDKLFRAALVVVVAILAPERAEEQAPPAAQRPPPPLRDTPPPAPPPASSGPKLSLGLGAGLHLGLAPSPVLALELEGKLLWPRWGVATSFRYLAPGSGVDDRERGVEVQVLGAAALGIFRPLPSLEARLGASAYALRGTGLGSAVKTEGTIWSGGPTAGVAFIPLRLRWFWGGLGAETQLDLVRGTFDIDDYGEVFAVPSFSGWGFVRAGLLLP